MPSLTVLMTVYNGMPYLSKAVESILGQTYSDFELLIIDDCSTDRSQEFLCDYGDPRIRLVMNESNLGQTRSLNRGLGLVATELVARMDHDDIAHPDRLHKQVNFLDAHADIAVVGTDIRWIDAGGVVLGEKRFPRYSAVLRFAQLFRCPLVHGAATFRRQVVWNELGGYDPAMRFSQDWELWSRGLSRYGIANIPELLTDVRVHESSATATYGPEIIAENSRIYHQNLTNILGLRAVSEEWSDRLEALAAMEIRRCSELIGMAESIYGLYCSLYPEAAARMGIVAELARHYARLIYHSTDGVGHLLYAIQVAVRRLVAHGFRAIYLILRSLFN